MKLTNVDIYPDSSSLTPISLNFKDPFGIESYTVKSIVGLDAEDIIPQYYASSSDGFSKFFSMMLQPRTIVVKVGLNPDFGENKSNSDLRDSLYRLISSSRHGRVRLLFKNKDVEVAELYGFVTKFESPLFEKTQEIQVTIKCDDPLLKEPTETIHPLVGLDPEFTTITDAVSTSPHGVLMFIDVLVNVSEIKIHDPADPFAWSFRVAPILGFQAGDIFVFNSDPLARFVQYFRGGSAVNVAEAIYPGSIWPMMFPGDNTISIDNPTAFKWRSIVYHHTYWGV